MDRNKKAAAFRNAAVCVKCSFFYCKGDNGKCQLQDAEKHDRKAVFALTKKREPTILNGKAVKGTSKNRRNAQKAAGR